MDSQTPPTPVAQAPSLSARLKEETRELHRMAERSGVMAELLHGRIARPAYLVLLGELLAIYTALEAGLDAHAHDPAVQRLWRPELRRRFALEQDLACLRASSSPQPPAGAATPAGRAYVGRLHALSASEPVLLLAHAYVRYLGDLYGGQVLGRLVRRQLDLPDRAGTSFYDLGEPERVDRLKREFRAGLDALALPAAQEEAFVAEACEAFRRHRQMFEELGRGQAAD